MKSVKILLFFFLKKLLLILNSNTLIEVINTLLLDYS